MLISRPKLSFDKGANVSIKYRITLCSVPISTRYVCSANFQLYEVSVTKSPKYFLSGFKFLLLVIFFFFFFFCIDGCFFFLSNRRSTHEYFKQTLYEFIHLMWYNILYVVFLLEIFFQFQGNNDFRPFTNYHHLQKTKNKTKH